MKVRTIKMGPGDSLTFGKVKTIVQSQLTADCWTVQIWGKAACEDCEFRGTIECGGKAILQKMETGEFPVDGLPDGGKL